MVGHRFQLPIDGVAWSAVLQQLMFGEKQARQELDPVRLAVEVNA